MCIRDRYLTDMGNGDKQVLAPTKISDLPVTNGSQTTAPDGQYILTCLLYTS